MYNIYQVCAKNVELIQYLLFIGKLSQIILDGFCFQLNDTYMHLSI